MEKLAGIAKLTTTGRGSKTVLIDGDNSIKKKKQNSNKTSCLWMKKTCELGVR